MILNEYGNLPIRRVKKCKESTEKDNKELEIKIIIKLG